MLKTQNVSYAGGGGGLTPENPLRHIPRKIGECVLSLKRRGGAPIAEPPMTFPSPNLWGGARLEFVFRYGLGLQCSPSPLAASWRPAQKVMEGGLGSS